MINLQLFHGSKRDIKNVSNNCYDLGGSVFVSISVAEKVSKKVSENRITRVPNPGHH